ncbi:MAG: xanthine dehydrogenase family protein subunit M, partial [Actinomycetota bacterium]|nr:xanthine dehydrogenase family protein subunit M [Actinomycetota bacterium]
RVPKLPDAKWSFQKFNRRAQDWAIVGAAIVYGEDYAGVGLVNMHSVPFRSEAVESALLGGASAEEAADLAADGTEAPTDLNASRDYREHLSRVLVRRGLQEAGR